MSLESYSRGSESRGQQIYTERYKPVVDLVDLMNSSDLGKIPTPFLHVLVESINNIHMGPEIKKMSGVDKEVALMGKACGKALIAANWDRIRKDRIQSAKFLLTPCDSLGRSIGSPSLNVLSLLLNGASNDQISDILSYLQPKFAISAEAIVAIRAEIEPFIVASRNIHLASNNNVERQVTPESLLTRGRVPEQDILPYLDLGAAQVENWGRLFDEIRHLTERKLATYGGINSDVLLPAALKSSGKLTVSAIEKAEICAPEDDALGLRMPQAWYFNPRWPAMAVAMLYNAIQTTHALRQPELNREFRKRYGVVALVECYKTDELLRFANAKGVTVFSTPIDLMLTAHYIASGQKPEGVFENEKIADYAHEIIKFASKRRNISPDSLKDYIRSLQDKERLYEVIHILRDYWQEILLPKGVDQNDDEIILFDPHYFDRATTGFASNRKPRTVFMGGNIDNVHSLYLDPVVVVARNLALAQTQYGKNTRIVVPQYKDEASCHYWFPQLRLPNHASIPTTDTLILHLFAVRELGLDKDFRGLKGRYVELYSRQKKADMAKS